MNEWKQLRILICVAARHLLKYMASHQYHTIVFTEIVSNMWTTGAVRFCRPLLIKWYATQDSLGFDRAILRYRHYKTALTRSDIISQLEVTKRQICIATLCHIVMRYSYVRFAVSSCYDSGDLRIPFICRLFISAPKLHSALQRMCCFWYIASCILSITTD